MKSFKLLIPVVLSLLLAGQAFGQVLSITERTVNLHSSPSLTGSLVVLQVPLYYPLQVEDERGNFFLVRDYRGRDAWVEKSVVGPESGIIVKADAANVRSGPGKDHEVIFKARQGVTFLVLKNQQDWLYVEHESGRKGWIHKSLTWGL
ncbi:MAG TPA: SH3 domain-containing protein [Geothermobacteraceae bacterium]|nr:SH3 domain-containing protein [Geothermobacteraceae bacterium]